MQMTSYFGSGAVLPLLPTHQSHTALYWLNICEEMDVSVLQAQGKKGKYLANQTPPKNPVLHHFIMLPMPRLACLFLGRTSFHSSCLKKKKNRSIQYPIHLFPICDNCLIARWE